MSEDALGEASLVKTQQGHSCCARPCCDLVWNICAVPGIVFPKRKLFGSGAEKGCWDKKSVGTVLY